MLIRNKNSNKFYALKKYSKIILKKWKKFDNKLKKYKDFSYIPKKEHTFFANLMKSKNYEKFLVKYEGYW